LMAIHLLEQSLLVFFVAHGGEPIQISACFSLFLALISCSESDESNWRQAAMATHWYQASWSRI
jgi:hypothetical protein